MSQKFLNPIEVDGQVSAEYLDLSTTTSHSVNAGEIAWNSIDGTFDIGLLNGVTLQAGQEMHFYGKATEAISNGNAVMFAGVQGDHILIAKADAVTNNADLYLKKRLDEFRVNNGRDAEGNELEILQRLANRDAERVAQSQYNRKTELEAEAKQKVASGEKIDPKQYVETKIKEEAQASIVRHNLGSDGTNVDDAINQAAAKYGFPQEMMHGMAMIESGKKPDAVSPSGDYKGLFQMGNYEFKKYSPIPNGDIFNPLLNSMAAAGYMDYHRKQLEKRNIPVTPVSIYLSHQQGLGGFSEIYRAAQEGRPVGILQTKDGPYDVAKAMLSNPPQDGRAKTTNPVDFLNRWQAVLDNKMNADSPTLAPQVFSDMKPVPGNVASWSNQEGMDSNNPNGGQTQAKPVDPAQAIFNGLSSLDKARNLDMVEQSAATPTGTFGNGVSDINTSDVQLNDPAFNQMNNQATEMVRANDNYQNGYANGDAQQQTPEITINNDAEVATVQKQNDILVEMLRVLMSMNDKLSDAEIKPDNEKKAEAVRNAQSFEIIAKDNRGSIVNKMELSTQALKLSEM